MDATFWNVFLQNVLLTLGVPLAVMGIRALWAVGQKYFAQAKAEQPELFEQIEWAAGLVVKAAEQAGVAQLITDKKAYAINALEKMLEAKGIFVDLDVVEAAIEAAVADLNAEPVVE